MKDYPSGIIVPELFLWNTGYDYLKANVKKNEFTGNNVKILMETTTPFTFQAFGERVDLPYGSPLGFQEMYIPLKEVISTAEITKQMMDRATGGDASWGAILPRILAARKRDFLWGMELCFMGDGTGRLARSNGAGVYDGSSTVSSTGKSITITCDNTYGDFGVENVALIKKGMWIEAYLANGTRSAESTTYAWKVCQVTFGDRDNSTATTGTVVIEVDSDINAQFDDGTTLFLAGTMSNASSILDDVGSSRRYEATNAMGSVEIYCTLPMGLLGLVQDSNASYDYSDGSINYTLDVFQGLAPASYDTLNSQVWDGSNLGGSRGTPEDWTLSVITDAINRVETDTGGTIDVIMVNSKMAIAMANQNASEGSATLSVTSTGKFDQPVAGTRYAKAFLAPDGRSIPIQICKSIPENCLYGLCLDDLIWYTKGDFAPTALTGEEWMLSPNQRKAVFEAPFGGYSQIGAVRRDRHILIQDMKNNI
jgi:hypothetical protein